jgi:aldehyde dehydrogenase (NAD+)
MAAEVLASYCDDPQGSAVFPRIVNQRDHDRLTALIEPDSEVVIGGTFDRDSCYLAPTILRNVSADAKVMEDEILGPILPVLAIDSLDEAIAFINARPHPLALYLFARNCGAETQVLAETISGGVAINDTIMHLAVRDGLDLIDTNNPQVRMPFARDTREALAAGLNVFFDSWW